MRFMSTLFAVALMTPAAGFSQTTQANDATADVGSRVRVAAPMFGAKKQLGTVASLSPDTVVLRIGTNPANRSLAVNEITSLEVVGGRHSQKAKGALWGTAIGAGVGGVLGYALYKEPKCESDGFGCPWLTIGPTSKGGNAAVSAIAGGIVGALVGVLVGSRSTETWVPGSFATR